ncbi:putative ternary complex factor MIP1, leucine-zipper [Rosa chinensis]|uniref:Putative ternary complex factor MIP1, leucine-zipper n=1 Tax=Rosa chinensis TaxID=74649 RepID=A0A2P6SKL0_ROSCH|nr:putative ternary complex factor MIP1, leucine-zipper [Rosa chinensis]
MKLEDFLMQRSEDKQKRLVLEEEVLKLQEELDGEQTLNRVLHCALHGPALSHPCLLSLLPPQVQELFSELEMVEDEISGLERKVEELKLMLYKERAQTREWEMHRRQWEQNQSFFRAGNQSLIEGSRSQNYEALRKEKRRVRDRRASVGSASDMQRWNFTKTDGEIAEMSRRLSRRSRIQSIMNNESGIQKPNELSEQLLKCLIGIFLELKQTSLEKEGSSSVVPKLTLSCMNSKGFMPKTSFNCKSSALFNYNTSHVDPYCILPDIDGAVRDVGPYKNFIQITRSSLDIRRLSDCSNGIEKLRKLMRQLCDVDLTCLTYKQKLAFWINIYNACIMHAFLDHGLPSTQEKLLLLMNKAALNVGGIVLNALAIEHFILRHPSETKQVSETISTQIILVEPSSILSDQFTSQLVGTCL